jgi:hypothetical protein
MSKELRRRRARLLAAAAFLGGIAVTGPALAQAAGTPPEADVSAQAAVLYEAGAKAFEANRLEEARAFFLAALRLKNHWQIAGNLGSIEFSMDRRRDAAEHLDFALRTAGDSISAQDRQKMQELLDKARTSIGSLSISVDVPGAEVLVDGRSVGKAPFTGPIYVEPGARLIEARREGYAVQQARREIGAGALAQVALHLERLPEASSGHGRTDPLAPRATSSDVMKGPNKAVLVVGTVVTGLAVGAGVVANGFVTRKEAEASDRALAANISMGAFIGGGLVGVATGIYALTGWSASTASSADKRVAVQVVGPGLRVKAAW